MFGTFDLFVRSNYETAEKKSIIEFPIPKPIEKNGFYGTTNALISSETERCPCLEFFNLQPIEDGFPMSPTFMKIGLLKSVSSQLIFVTLEDGSTATFQRDYAKVILVPMISPDQDPRIFQVLATRAFRASMLIALTSNPNLKLSHGKLVEFFSLAIPEYCPLYTPLVTLTEGAKHATELVSSIGFITIINQNYYRSLLLTAVSSYSGVCTDLFGLMMTELKKYITEPMLTVETPHPLRYTRIDRTIAGDNIIGFLALPDKNFQMPYRGMVVQRMLIKDASQLSAPIRGNSLYLHAAANEASSDYGAKLQLLPLTQYCADRAKTPASWLIHFGISFVNLITALKLLVTFDPHTFLGVQLSPIMRPFSYDLFAPFVMKPSVISPQTLADVFVLHGGLQQLPKTTELLQSIETQQNVLLTIASLLQYRAFQLMPYKRFFQSAVFSRFISPQSIENARKLTALNELIMETKATEFGSSIDFICKLFAFQGEPALVPYFDFFELWLKTKEHFIVLESPHPIPVGRSKISISIPNAISYSLTSVEPTISFVISGADDFYFRVVSAGTYMIDRKSFTITVDSPADSWGYSIKISPTYSFYNEEVIISEFPDFMVQMDIMNAKWRKRYDEILTKYIDHPDIMAALSITERATLSEFEERLVKTRFLFIRGVNESFNANQANLTESDQPFVRLMMSASSAFSSSMKLRRLEKMICKTFGQKKTFTFNRSRALIAKNEQSNRNGKSLFDQMIEQIPISSLKVLKCKDAPWRVTLEGEGAADAGGPGRDLFTDICAEITMPHNHLFIATPRSVEDGTCNEFIPDPRCVDKAERFVYVGAFVALAFVTQIQQPFHFAPLVWAALCGEKVTVEHIYQIDPRFTKEMKRIEGGSVENLHFTVLNIAGETVQLIHGGANQIVTINDRSRYLQLAQAYRVNELTVLLKAMLKGFNIFLGNNIQSFMVTPDELRTFICGAEDIPINELKKLIHVHSAKTTDTDNLDAVLRSFTPEERMLFIKFVTGKMSIPAHGASWNGHINVVFVKLQDPNPPYPLPLSATCSSTIDIPRYPTKEILAEKLRAAIEFGQDIVLDHAFDAGEIAQ